MVQGVKAYRFRFFLKATKDSQMETAVIKADDQLAAIVKFSLQFIGINVTIVDIQETKK